MESRKAIFLNVYVAGELIWTKGQVLSGLERLGVGIFLGRRIYVKGERNLAAGVFRWQ